MTGKVRKTLKVFADWIVTKSGTPEGNAGFQKLRECMLEMTIKEQNEFNKQFMKILEQLEAEGNIKSKKFMKELRKGFSGITIHC